MKSATHPTIEELRTWAFDSSSVEPVQDWDLVLSWVHYDDVYLEFASSKVCPKADYFLALLYLIVGDAVRTAFRSRSKEDLAALLDRAEHRFPAFVVRRWIQRSRYLIAHPDSFDYDGWCAGGLARE